MKRIKNINDLEKKSSILALQKITASAHVPAVAYSCVELKEESENKFVSTSLTVGNKDAQPTDTETSEVNANTRFPASSLSKIVFTYLVLQLVKKNKIRLDDTLHKILPYKRFLVNEKYPDKATKLTVQHVLSHTTGLPNFGPNWTPELSTTLLFDDKSKLGEGYSYSGEAFYYLQMVIESKMRKDLETLAKEYVFTPLKMHRSTFLPQPEGDNIVKVHSELGKSTLINEDTPHFNVANAAGSLLTTADDFSKFIAVWLENKNDPIIKQAFVPTNTEGFMRCGLGWHLYRSENKLIAYQYGQNFNTRSFVAMNLTDEKGAAFFTNAEQGMSIANPIFSLPDLAPVGDMRAVFKYLGYSQSDEPGWQETFEGRIAEDQGFNKKDQKNFEEARDYYEKALEKSPKDKSKQRRLKWFNAVHQRALETQVFTLPLEQFEGIFENAYKDKVEISIRDNSLIYKVDHEIKLVRKSETEFLPEKDQSFRISFDGDQMIIHYLQGRPKILKQSSSKSQKESAVEILIFKPDPSIPPDQRGVHENLWIKQHFKQYVSIGVYLEGSDLKYYFFEDCNNTSKTYTSLVDLKKELPNELENIFEKTPKLFIMGHGHGGIYGLSNVHGSSEQIYGTDFDKIITDFKAALSEQQDEIFVTLEACNTDNRALADKKGQEKTFLERLSTNHPNMTFCGTGPWDPKDAETGFRASGGFPTLNTPITAMGGGIWKHGNSVIFYLDNNQIVVKKSMFASTETAKELKINTIEYARAVLKKTFLDNDAIEEMITKICANRDILKIKDLKKVPDFPQEEFEAQEITKLVADEKRLLEKEKNHYITRVEIILESTESGEKFSEKELLIIALGLKNLSVFQGREDLRDEILADKNLLSLILVTCGKVLIADQSNDSLIDFLLERGIDINSVDEKGMTALHYATQNFYNYRKEPLNLINKLLDCGANLKAEDTKGRTPLMLAAAHSQKGTVIAGENLLKLLEQRQIDPVDDSAPITRSLVSTNLGFFEKLEEEDLTEQRQDDPKLQCEYDQKLRLT